LWDDASQRLFDELMKSVPEIDIVKSLVKKNANILHGPVNANNPTQHCCLLILKGNLQALEASGGEAKGGLHDAREVWLDATSLRI